MSKVIVVRSSGTFQTFQRGRRRGAIHNLLSIVAQEIVERVPDSSFPLVIELDRQQEKLDVSYQAVLRRKDEAI